ncbi:ankyrin repeat and EF-hand domain-containing protein 1 [Hoplias malabaricus]|uniref:ankyrin repeat and EF-hand domain-containing protein 1 n=1 Tax=Hoplias malabaricus TaxID=27720 RepID=UPI003463519D
MFPRGGMSPVAEGRMEVLQVFKLLQLVREGAVDKIEKLIRLGVPGLINLTEPSEGLGALHITALCNALDLAPRLLALGAHPDVRDLGGRTAAMRAAQLGHYALLELLTTHHADINLLDHQGRGVLYYSIFPSVKHARCLQVALRCGADVNSVCSVGTPVLLKACENAGQCEDMCLRLLENGADPNATDQGSGRTALMEAARFGRVKLVREILRRGGNPNRFDKKKTHVLHLAAQGGFLEVIQVLSAYSADFSVLDSDVNTPLHFAAAGGFTECCRFLAQRGCNPKLKNVKGLVPRQIAKEKGHKAALKELKKAEKLHSNLNGTENPNELWALTLHDWSCEHETTLRKAFEAEMKEPVENVSRDAFASVLQAHHAPVDQERLQKIVMDHDKKREGVVNLSDFFKGLVYLQKAFVLSSYAPKTKKGGKGKRKGKYVFPLPICTLPPELMSRREGGGPPNFMIESYQQFTDTKRFSRDRPPVHPVQDDSAWYLQEPERIYTNISSCVKTDDFESLYLAFSQDVPVDVRDRFYKTPLMTACSTGRFQMVKFLIRLGADVNACDQFNWTPLHHACFSGHLDVLDLLVRSGSKVNSVALNGATPLMRAIESGRVSCVDYLIQHGANVQAQNNKQQSCLDIARQFGDKRIIDLIQTKLDRLSKRKGGRKSPNPAAPSARKVVPPLMKNTVEKKEDLKENIITLNPHSFISASSDKHDIGFTPRTVWGKRLATSAQHMERKVDRRNHLFPEVEFKGFVFQKTLDLTAVGR